MTNSSISRAVLAGCIFLSMSACFFACMYFFNPRVKIEYMPIPGPAPAAPDSVMIILSGLDRLRLSTAALERANSDLRRQLSVRTIKIALPTTKRWTIPPEDTAVGLKLYRSEKTFIHPTMHFGSIESHIEATAPLPVQTFMNTVRFMEGEEQIYSRIGMEWKGSHPCPPGHFWTGFGYGGMTGFALAFGAILLIGK